MAIEFDVVHTKTERVILRNWFFDVPLLVMLIFCSSNFLIWWQEERPRPCSVYRISWGYHLPLKTKVFCFSSIVYYRLFPSDLQFLLDPNITKIHKDYSVTLAQLTPNAFLIVVEFVELCKHLNLIPFSKVFLWFHIFREDEGWISFHALLERKLLDHIYRSNLGWREKFFFISRQDFCIRRSWGNVNRPKS